MFTVIPTYSVAVSDLKKMDDGRIILRCPQGDIERLTRILSMSGARAWHVALEPEPFAAAGGGKQP